ncbi:hypothetical protein Tco_0374764 [Tanacetum coccineum]
MNAILGMYTDIDEYSDMACNYLKSIKKCQHLEKELSKRNENVNNKSFIELSKEFLELEQHSINLELALQQCQEQMKNDNVWKQNESSSFRDLNEQYFVINDLKAQLQDKDIAISVNFTTSISRLQLKSTQLEDRVMRNNFQVKTKKVEDHRRKFKFSNNKTYVTACNDSLNAKTSNVNFVCVTCSKCVFNQNHDLCALHYVNGVNSITKKPIAVPINNREPKRSVNQSVATPHRKTVALEFAI